MRFGRMILAGLAPLVGLSALAAGLAAYPHQHIPPKSAQQVASADPLPRLLQAIAPWLVSAANSIASSSSGHGAARAVFTLEALWLLAGLFAINFFERRHQRAFLRC